MKKKSKIIFTLFIVILCIALTILLIPFVKLLSTEQGRDIIDEKISSLGIFAPLAFICLEILQIVAAFVPGAPVEILGGVLFGGFWGVILCFAGIFTGSALVFSLVKKFGQPLVHKIFSQEKLERNKFMKLMNDEKKLTLIIFILFLIPGTPKDFLTYIAALTSINPYKFFFIAAIARTPSMACSVFMGASIGEGRYIMSLVLFGVIILLSIIGYLVKNKIDKNKEKHIK